jgi:hypothetical protein
MTAICHRCGSKKSGPFVPCKACSHVPQGADRNVAWLFSEAHLSENELKSAALRVQRGERPDPSLALQDLARDTMGAAPRTDAGQTPLPTPALLGIASANLLLSPMAGFAVWFGYRSERPVAAAQALRITIPIAIALAALWVGMVGLRLFG